MKLANDSKDNKKRQNRSEIYTLVGFKVDDSISIRQAIQNPIQEKLLSEVKREKVNRR
jgi:hypothetical protein